LVASPIAIAEWLIGRIHRWTAESDGRLVLIKTRDDLARCVAETGPIGVVIGVQGGHVLEGSLDNVARLREKGVRMFAPAHVMDNAIVGSSTGRSATGLTAFGREALAALEKQSVIVDLAHMSVAGVEESMAALSKPFTLSHTGLTDIARGRSLWRRYSASNRNVPASLAREIGAAGGLLGVCLSTQLLGARDLAAAAQTFRLAVESASESRVAIGSDMDGALEMLVDVEGLPALAGALRDVGMPASTVRGVMGANALEWLRMALPAHS
jgi:microsomal dipeptidase-like Zn-dependent dipeptidase